MKLHSAILSLIILALFGFTETALAKALPPAPGRVFTYQSENGQYQLEIKILGYPDSSPSDCAFKENGKMLWRKTLATTPGMVRIANNGSSFVFANWGWYDEGGYRSLSFYSREGNLLKEIGFDDTRSKGGMLWCSEMVISADGEYLLLAASGGELHFYRVNQPELLWKKKVGFTEPWRLAISEKGDYLLNSSYEYEADGINDMKFSYLNRKGEIIWEAELKDNHYWLKWDRENSVKLDSQGKKFRILNSFENRLYDYENKDGKVIKKGFQSLEGSFITRATQENCQENPVYQKVQKMIEKLEEDRRNFICLEIGQASSSPGDYEVILVSEGKDEVSLFHYRSGMMKEPKETIIPEEHYANLWKELKKNAVWDMGSNFEAEEIRELFGAGKTHFLTVSRNKKKNKLVVFSPFVSSKVDDYIHWFHELSGKELEERVEKSRQIAQSLEKYHKVIKSIKSLVNLYIPFISKG